MDDSTGESYGTCLRVPAQCERVSPRPVTSPSVFPVTREHHGVRHVVSLPDSFPGARVMQRADEGPVRFSVRRAERRANGRSSGSRVPTATGSPIKWGILWSRFVPPRAFTDSMTLPPEGKLEVGSWKLGDRGSEI